MRDKWAEASREWWLHFKLAMIGSRGKNKTTTTLPGLSGKTTKLRSPNFFLSLLTDDSTAMEPDWNQLFNRFLSVICIPSLSTISTGITGVCPLPLLLSPSLEKRCFGIEAVGDVTDSILPLRLVPPLQQRALNLRHVFLLANAPVRTTANKVITSKKRYALI